MHSEEIRETLRKRNIEKYGVENPALLDLTKEKARKTIHEKYGTWVPRLHLSKAVIDKLSDIEYIVKENVTKSPLQIARELGVSDATIYKIFERRGIEYIKHVNSSIWEAEVITYIHSISIHRVVENDRTILDRLELDAYLPELNVAFECNGSYWHSENNGKDKTYHIKKTNMCAEKGIRLIHLWEHEWKNKQSIVKSIISAAV